MSSKTTEQSLIFQLALQLPEGEHLFSDDAFWDPTTRQVMSSDLFIEGRHFDLNYFTLQDVGWKTLAASLSDIAAMGAVPRQCLVSIGLPSENKHASFLTAFYEGMQALLETLPAQNFSFQPPQCRIVGGDLTESAQWIINVTVIGMLAEGSTPAFRKNATPGQEVYITGFPGLSAAGLQLLKQAKEGFPACKQSHLRPLPRIEEGLFLSSRFRHIGLMDSSDGLADALIQIAQRSQVRLEIDPTLIPIHAELAAVCQLFSLDPLELALYGGEDFELVATLPEGSFNLPATFTRIGRVVEADTLLPDTASAVLITNDLSGKEEVLCMSKTYQHFRE